MAEPRLQHRVDDATQNEMLAYVLEHALDAGQASVKRGPELLPILRDAGVVDAGGYGLTIIFAGVIAALRGADPPPLEHYSPARITQPAARTRPPTATARTSPSPARTSRPAPWIARLERLGDSVLVVGDAHTLKVHVHTDEPERATGLFDGVGAVSRLDVADMHEQVEQRTPARPRGARHLRRARGRQRRRHARALRGHGRARARRRRDAEPVDLRAAGRHPRGARRGGRRPAELAERPHGRRARRRALGEARPRRPDALDGLRPRGRGRAGPVQRRAARNAAAMEETLSSACAPAASPRPPATTPRAASAAATRVGFIDEELVAWGEPGETLEVVLGELGREAELLTVIEGDGAPLGGDAVAGAGARQRRGRARARRPAGLVVARLAPSEAASPSAVPRSSRTRYAAPRGTTTTGTRRGG